MVHLPTPAPRPGKTEVVAHRGASAEAPENTLAAFARAIELGAGWLELDATRCASGEVVVIHDATLERTTDGQGPVATRSLAELRRLDAGGWKQARFRGERVPTLREVLDLARDRIGVYLEIKPRDDDPDPALRAALLSEAGDALRRDPALDRRLAGVLAASDSPDLPLARAVVDEVRGAGQAEQVVIQSFSPAVCLQVLLLAPELRVELLLWEGEGPPRPAMWEEGLRWLYLLDLPGANPPRESLTPGRLAAFQAAGRSVAVWTVDDEAELRRFTRWGVQRLITNRPDLALRVVREEGR